MKEQYENVQWRLWQRIVLNALERDPDPRKMLWIWDQSGNKGKSFLATYLAKDAFVTGNGKSADIKYPYDGQQIVVFDFSRTQQAIVNYEVKEDIKNGQLFSTKYESCMKIHEVPQESC